MVACNFCGYQIKKGTGKMYVYVTGRVDNFCSSKCEKNMLKLKRNPNKFKWTKHYEKVR